MFENTGMKGFAWKRSQMPRLALKRLGARGAEGGAGSLGSGGGAGNLGGKRSVCGGERVAPRAEAAAGARVIPAR